MELAEGGGGVGGMRAEVKGIIAISLGQSGWQNCGHQTAQYQGKPSRQHRQWVRAEGGGNHSNTIATPFPPSLTFGKCSVTCLRTVAVAMPERVK